jgi:hypothetical protein
MSTRSARPFAAALAALIYLVGSSFNLASAAEASPSEVAQARRDLALAARAWLEATLQGDFSSQAVFYPERMEAFYLWREVPRSAVMAEKRKVFAQARTVELEMEPPQILLSDDARSARMYFRKAYVIEGQVNRVGEVLQELRWAKEEEGWKIVSERDLRVIRQVRGR